jgi:hypothetical protein
VSTVTRDISVIDVSTVTRDISVIDVKCL